MGLFLLNISLLEFEIRILSCKSKLENYFPNISFENFFVLLKTV